MLSWRSRAILGIVIGIGSSGCATLSTKAGSDPASVDGWRIVVSENYGSKSKTASIERPAYGELSLRGLFGAGNRFVETFTLDQTGTGQQGVIFLDAIVEVRQRMSRDPEFSQQVAEWTPGEDEVQWDRYLIQRNAVCQYAGTGKDGAPAFGERSAHLAYNPAEAKDFWKRHMAVSECGNRVGVAFPGRSLMARKLLKELVHEIGEEYPPGFAPEADL